MMGYEVIASLSENDMYETVSLYVRKKRTHKPTKKQRHNLVPGVQVSSGYRSHPLLLKWPPDFHGPSVLRLLGGNTYSESLAMIKISF